MKNDKTVLEAVLRGYDGENDTSYWSSSVWMAHKAGKTLNTKGYTRPVAAKMGRGYSVRILSAANEFVIKFVGKDLETIQMERIG